MRIVLLAVDFVVAALFFASSASAGGVEFKLSEKIACVDGEVAGTVTIINNTETEVSPWADYVLEVAGDTGPFEPVGYPVHVDYLPIPAGGEIVDQLSYYVDLPSAGSGIAVFRVTISGSGGVVSAEFPACQIGEPWTATPFPETPAPSPEPTVVSTPVVTLTPIPVASTPAPVTASPTVRVTTSPTPAALSTSVPPSTTDAPVTPKKAALLGDIKTDQSPSQLPQTGAASGVDEPVDPLFGAILLGIFVLAVGTTAWGLYHALGKRQ